MLTNVLSGGQQPFNGKPVFIGARKRSFPAEMLAFCSSEPGASGSGLSYVDLVRDLRVDLMKVINAVKKDSRCGTTKWFPVLGLASDGYGPNMTPALVLQENGEFYHKMKA
jgi:hypothetical protein